MDLVTPGIGLLFWMSISFLTVIFLLRKFAWKPILNALREREESISKSLAEADKARQAMANLKQDSETILKEARAERDAILKQARDAKNVIMEEAKGTAKQEADKLLQSARDTIHNEKMAALTELKNQVAMLSIEIAEKVLKGELSEEKKQKTLIKNLLDEVKLN